ncbi:MAG: FkbM family methyltransferase [Pseudomonadota bacterium]
MKPDQFSRAQIIVRGLYRSLLGREPDPAGLQHWSAVIVQEGSAGSVCDALVNSDEFQGKVDRHAMRDQAKAALAAHILPLLVADPLLIVDVGAQELEGEEHVYSAIAHFALPHHIIGFEPLEEKIKERQRLNPAQPITLLPTFIGDGEPHTFHINDPDATSSLLPLNQDFTRLMVDLSQLRTVQTESVNTSTLDRALQETGRIDFLKLDIQGFELPALSFATSVLARTNVVHCEVAFAEIYKDQALFSDVEALLREHGFYFLDFSSTCHYPYHGASDNPSRDRLGWGDAVFFKKEALLSDSRDLLGQLAIAMLVYDKPSFAEYLAQRYDEATGASVATIFNSVR